MARIVLAVAAGVVGYFASGGNPYVALQVGTLAYGFSGFLDPNKKVQGPRLSDLKAPQATYGSPIAYIEGAPRGAWNVAWASDKREIATTDTTSKGGPGVESTTFTYEMDVLYLVDINGASALRRVWSNGKLVWSNGDDADGETLAASEVTTSWREIRFYTGALDQLPDPVYETAVGVGNAPAYRGRCTIMVEGLNLGGSGQMPVLTFEVLTESAAAFDVISYPLAAPVAVPQAQGTTAFKLNEPFDLLVAGADIDVGAGRLYSFDVYSVDPVAQTSTLVGNFPIGAHNTTTILGNSDESCFMVEEPGGSPVDFLDYYAADGSTVRLDTTSNPFAGHVFSKLGDDIVLATYDISSGDRKLRRYSRASGVLVATAATGLPANVQSIAIGGGYIYSLATTGTVLYKSDLTTLALVDTILIPADYTANSGEVACDGDTPYIFGAGSVPWTFPLVKWTGSTWEPIAYASNTSGVPHDPDPTPALADLYAEPVNNQRLGFGEGVLFSQKFNVGSGYVEIRYLLGKVAIVYPTLDQVVRRLCLRTGQLTDADIDVTDLEDDIVRAMAITQPTTTRGAIEILMAAYLFECAEGEVLRFVKRGGASVASIPYDDLAASQDGNAEPLPLKRLNDPEIAARVSVKFANVLNDFQDGVVQADRLVTESTAEQVVEVPLGFTPTEAARLADANTMDLAVGLIQIGPIALPRKWSALEPTDVITLTDANGDTFRARITKGTIGGGILQFDLVLDDATAINSVAETDSNYESSTLIRTLSSTDLELLDIPILRDADDGPGLYAAVTAGENWPGAEIDKSPDDVTYSKVVDASTRSVIGTATTTLPDFAGGNVFDEISSLTVDVGDGELSSTTRDALLTGVGNAMLVGSEIVQFRDAVLGSPGVYTLTGFLRGRRGTEWDIPDHVAGERVVLLEATALRHIDEEATEIGIPRYWKAVTFGKSRASAVTVPFTDTGIALKPFSPANLRVLPNEIGDIVATWNRRSRLATTFIGTGSVVPLGEASERYHWQALVSSVVVDSGYTTSPTYTLSKGAQLAVGIAVGVTAVFSVAQVSATVGDGYASTLEFEGTGVAQPQISTVTVGGTYQSGKQLYVLIDSTTVSYTTTVPDATLAGIATSLAAAINSALPTYTATALSGVITVTGPAGHAFTISAGMVGEETEATVLNLAAAAASPGIGQKMVVGIYPFAGSVSSVLGATYRLFLYQGVAGFATRTVTYTYVATTAGWNGVQLMTALVGSTPTTSDGLPATGSWNLAGDSHTVSTPTGEYWSAGGFFSGDSNAYVGTSISRAAVIARPSDVAQVSSAWLVPPQVVSTNPPFTTPAGYIYRITINGTAYDRTVVGGDTYLTVLAALKATINGSSLVVTADDAYYIANAIYNQPPQLIVTAVTGNVPFTIDSRLVPGLINLTTALVQAAS